MPRFHMSMGTKSRETIYGGAVRASAEQAAEARKEADQLACEALETSACLAFRDPAFVAGSSERQRSQVVARLAQHHFA